MSETIVNKTTPDFLSAGLEGLRGPKAKSIEQEKARLKKASQEFEAFFEYQMLKTMRQTVPESPFSKNSPMSADAGKDTYTDIFDMEVARKMSSGKDKSVADLLYHSLEKLIDNEYSQPNATKPELKPFRPEKDSFIKVTKQARPISREHQPLKLERSRSGPISLLNDKPAENVEDLSKKPKAP